MSQGRCVLPSMGLAWAHCVTTRVFVAKHGGGHVSTGRTRRFVQVSRRRSAGRARTGGSGTLLSLKSLG